MGSSRSFGIEFAKGISEFARSTTEAMRTLTNVPNQNFERYTVAAENAQADLEQSIATGDPDALTLSTLTLLDSMRTMVKASGVEAKAGRALDTQFRGLRDMVQ